MSKLKFLFLGLCMTIALVGCPSPVEVAPVVAAPDPIDIRSLKVSLDGGDLYSVSHDGNTVIDNDGVIYTSDTAVSGTKKVYKNSDFTKIIGFEGTGKGYVRFFMAATKADLFKAAAEKTVDSKRIWKDESFSSVLVGRTYTDTRAKQTFKFYSEATGSGMGAPTKTYIEARSTEGDKALVQVYELKTIYSETQGWFVPKAGSTTSLYEGIIIAGETIKRVAMTSDAPSFTTTRATPTFSIISTETAFLAAVKGKTASGQMTPTITVSFTWTDDGKGVKFDLSPRGVLNYEFSESSDALIGIYEGNIIELPATEGGMGSFGGIPFKYGTFESFVKARVTGRTAKGKNTDGADVTYTWNADGSSVSVKTGAADAVAYAFAMDSATSALVAKYGTTTLTLNAGVTSAGGMFGEDAFTFDVVAP